MFADIRAVLFDLDGTLIDSAPDLGAAAGAFFPAGNVPNQYCQVKSFLSTDLTMRYKLDSKLSFHASVTNLFNTKPPVDFNTYGGGQLPFNPSLHSAGAIGRFINVGMNYNF